MSLSEKINPVADVLVLAAGLLLLSWFYYELYHALLSPPLGFGERVFGRQERVDEGERQQFSFEKQYTENDMKTDVRSYMNDVTNGDLSVQAIVDTARVDWAASPSASVWRKRVHLVGPPESGQVTSVVRYEPQSRFPAHDHPEGEEILVLDGVFSDEHGDWPAGTYLLNPEGFRHAPFSGPGCLLFVKLRQFPGRERRHVVVDTHKLNWQPSSISGVAQKALYQQSGFYDAMRLERWDPQTDLGPIIYERGVEFFVLEGRFADDAGAYTAGCWMRLPAGAKHHPRTAEGCTLYIKTAGLPYLRSAVA